MLNHFWMLTHLSRTNTPSKPPKETLNPKVTDASLAQFSMVSTTQLYFTSVCSPAPWFCPPPPPSSMLAYNVSHPHRFSSISNVCSSKSSTQSSTTSSNVHTAQHCTPLVAQFIDDDDPFLEVPRQYLWKTTPFDSGLSTSAARPSATLVDHDTTLLKSYFDPGGLAVLMLDDDSCPEVSNFGLV